MNENVSIFLNASRWLAAVAVLISHVRHLILVDLVGVTNKTLLCKVFYFITGLGHEAVIVFFVISGFLVGGHTWERWRNEGPRLRSFVSARVSRIYTVLIPALLVGLGFDAIGLHWINASELYTNALKYHTISLDNTLSGTLNLGTFIGNLFMLQGILCGNLGSNSPLWSLSYEWWYYCLFGLVALSTFASPKRRVVYVALAGSLVLVLPMKFVVWGSIWGLGIAAYMWIKYSRWRPHPLLGMVTLIVAVGVSRLSHNTSNVAHREPISIEFIRDIFLGIGYVVALVSTSRLSLRIPGVRINERLAAFSYTTYLCHFPVVMLLVSVGFQWFGLDLQVQPTVYGVAYFFGLCITIFAYCFLFSLVTERHTAQVRNRLNSLLAVRKLSGAGV